jgi:hypothetical protein
MPNEVEMSLRYEIQHGSYYLLDRTKPRSALSPQPEVRLMADEIALAFDRESGTLHKHGKPETVELWATGARKTFRDGGFPDMAEDIIVMSGKFPIEELNKCLECTGYCLDLYKKLSTLSLS